MVRYIIISLWAFASTGLAFGQTWNGGGAIDNWSTGANWIGGVSPVSATTTSIAFAGTTRLTPNQNIVSPFVLNSLAFSSGAGAFNLTGSALTFDGATRTVTSDTNSNVTITSAASWTGSGTIAANGTGSITFSGASTTFAGTTLFTQGTINLNSTTTTATNLTLGNGTGAVLVNTGSQTLTLNGNVSYDGGAGFPGGVAELRGQVDLNGGVRTFSADNPGASPAYDLIVSAKLIGGAGSGLTVPNTSLGNILLTNQNTYSGPTTFNNNLGSVYLGANNALPTTSPITLGPTAFLSLRTVAQGSIAAVDFNHQFASLASTATDAEVRFGNTSTLTVGDASSTTYAGIFTQSTSTGTPSLVKTGTGSFTLAGNSAADPAVGVLAVAFSGTVTVNQGRLIVTTAPGVTGVFNNSGTGRATVTVSTGGTLAGTGAIVPDKGSQASNTITIATGGTVDPGTTAGTIGNLFIGAATAKSNVTINGTYRVDLTTVSSDQLTIIGSLALGANSILDASGITSTPGGPTTLQFTIATFDAGSLSGTFNLGSSVIPAGSSIQYNSNSIVLFVPVPEPGSVLALTAGAMAGLAALRRHFVSRV